VEKKYLIERLAEPKAPRKQSASFTLADQDNRAIDWMAQELGCSRSDVVRRAIRLVATDMGFDQNG
jgi:Arc/MetJ-type ribon-helix-helix transcriptional regulator